MLLLFHRLDLLEMLHELQFIQTGLRVRDLLVSLRTGAVFIEVVIVFIANVLLMLETRRFQPVSVV